MYLLNEEWQQRKSGSEKSRADYGDVRCYCVGSARNLAVGTGGQVRVKGASSVSELECCKKRAEESE